MEEEMAGMDLTSHGGFAYNHEENAGDEKARAWSAFNEAGGPANAQV